MIFTDDRKELLKAVSRPDDPMSATELAQGTPEQPKVQDRLKKKLAFARRRARRGRMASARHKGRATNTPPARCREC